MSGLLDFLATAGPIATQAGGDLAQGQANADQTRIQQAIQTIQMQRQAHEQMLKDALTQAQTQETTAKAGTYTPEYAGQKAAAVAAAQEPFDIDKANRDLQNNLAVAKARGATDLEIAGMRIAGEKDIANAQIQAAAARQTNQQNYQTGQNALNRTATATNQANAQAAARARVTQTQSGDILPQLENIIHRGPLAHPAPAPTPVSPSVPATASTPSPTTPTKKTTGDPILDQFLQPVPGNP
jgi:predicted O-linked N-acetylglucosamine transferase (SPINDLY family)